jgi:hypothetical protein
MDEDEKPGLLMARHTGVGNEKHFAASRANLAGAHGEGTHLLMVFFKRLNAP